MTQKAIRSYVQHGLEQGYSLEHLKLELVKSGHKPSEIERALKEKETKKKIQHHQRFDKMLIGGVFFLMLALMFVLSMFSEQSLFNIFLGFLPTIISITLTIIIVETYKENHSFIWAIPLVFIALFYVMAPNYLIFANLDLPQITVMNVIISYLFIMVINFISPPQHPHLPPPTHVTEPQIIIKEVPKEVIREIIKEVPAKETVQTLEDKCKAINQVIGRVYRKRVGGTKAMREKINIPRAWYNAFSKDQIDFNLLKKLLERLSMLNKKEKEIWTTEHKALKKLKRNKEGNDRILTVLKTNDEDPIEKYVASAIAVCEKALK
ncbi:hypothetical protein J4410_04850 [Candidatus Woesearchaeota archaeon]|nr:hypothetical protein [Candidatus Woesearchaeota archaeon]